MRVPVLLEESQHAPATSVGSGRRILIVDDEPLICMAFKKVLELRLPFPCAIETASSGVEALAKARALPPDLVLLDIRMPGMCGIEVCKELKADPRTTAARILFVSANDPPSHMDCPEMFLTKPVTLAALCAAVVRVLEGRRGASPA